MSDRTAVGPDLTKACGPDLLFEGIRGKLRELVGVLVHGELEEALNLARYARFEGRTGFRNGTKPRRLHTGMGTLEIDKPRAQMMKAN